MAFKAAPIWGCATIHSSHLGASDLGSRPYGFAFNLKHDLGRFPKLECCCLGVLAQRAINPVEDEKPCVPAADSSGAIERTPDNESRAFHKDLSLLPSEFIRSHFSPCVILIYFNSHSKVFNFHVWHLIAR